jgi:poly-gamma-glutamate synthesis protein (capsule biosynthesis protein)
LKKLLLFIPAFIFADYSANVSYITPKIKQKMVSGGSYKSYCPIKLKDLRYIKLTYWGFDNKEHTGELIVNKSISKDIVSIFKQLHKIKYPIHKMELVSKYKANDFASIEADNTSTFNCRYVDGTTKWSNHTYGKAIDINPIENPYVSKSGHTSHKKSYPYIKRDHTKSKAVMLKSDYIVKLFKAHGFRWGGDWRCCKDYQHFDKK